VNWRRALLLALAVGACGAEDAGLLVRFHSPRAIPAEADALRVTVVDAADETELDDATYDLVVIGAFPATLGLVRGDDTPAMIRIEAVVLLDEIAVATGMAEARFMDGMNKRIEITLHDL
jgi:hypothetical protein